MCVRVEPTLPPVKTRYGQAVREHRDLVQVATYHYRTGTARLARTGEPNDKSALVCPCVVGSERALAVMT
jgi:hypothetical protein